MTTNLLRSLVLLLYCNLSAQEQRGDAVLVAFYNVENLFEYQDGKRTSNTLYSFDKPGWTKTRFDRKVSNLARVISSLGTEFNKNGPDLLGIAEVENMKVLQDLTGHPLLSTHDYGIVHHDSPDHRGIDVALLYKRSEFIPIKTQARRLILITTRGTRNYTRDILVISGYLRQELIHIIINHWPSRRGGKQQSEMYRLEAARLNLRIIDSLKRRYSAPVIINMGDFNDDPTDPSLNQITRSLKAKGEIDTDKLINPMFPLYRKGYGSLAYRDRWHLFDQILVSGTQIPQNQDTLKLARAGIFMPSWIKTGYGAFRGYPLRTYSGNRYTEGYSDHFPVYLLFKLTPGAGALRKPNVVRNTGKDQH